MSTLGGKTVRWVYDGKSTHCEIKRDKETVLATGSVKLFHKDIPNKRVARNNAFRLAMTQAAERNTISKEERTAIWADYRATIKQPV